MSRRELIRLLGKGALAAGGIAILGGCSSPTDPDPPKTEYVHELAVYADYFFAGGAASGNFQAKMRSNGQTYTGAIGQKITLAKTYSREEICDILIQANSAHPREFLQIGVTNTDITTNVAESNKLNVDGLLEFVLYDGKNRSWTPRTVKAIFNPATDGTRLSQVFIDEIVRAMTNIKDWSKGYIQGLTFDNGDKTQGTTTPPEGEIWIFKEIAYSGASNGTYPPGGGKVTSSKIFINIDSADPLMAYNETGDAFVQGEQNGLTSFQSAPEWFAFMFNRPRDTNSYVISREKESQTGLDSSTQVQSYAQTTIQRIPDPTSFNSFMGERDYMEMESISPSRSTPLRQGQQELERKKSIWTTRADGGTFGRRRS